MSTVVRYAILVLCVVPTFGCASTAGPVVSRSLSARRESHQSGRVIPNQVYHALIIGNYDYNDNSYVQLKTPKADAEDVKKALEDDYGFSTKLLLNATRGDIIGALAGYEQLNSEEGHSLLIYYAGHGYIHPETLEFYWIPVDAASDVRTEWVSQSDLAVSLRGMHVQHVLVVSDSCHSGGLVEGPPSGGNPPEELSSDLVRRLAAKKARLALTSASRSEIVVDDAGGGHSAFTKQFLHVLHDSKESLDSASLYSRLLPLVGNRSNQTPIYGGIANAGHESGVFVFPRSTVLPSLGPHPPEIDQPPVNVLALNSLVVPLGLAGAISIGLTGYFALRAQDKVNDAQNTCERVDGALACKSAADLQNANEALGDAKTARGIAIGFGVASSVFGAGAIYLGVSSPPSRDVGAGPKAGEGSVMAISPVISQSYSGVRFVRSF